MKMSLSNLSTPTDLTALITSTHSRRDLKSHRELNHHTAKTFLVIKFSSLPVFPQAKEEW